MSRDGKDRNQANRRIEERKTLKGRQEYPG